MAIVDGSTSGSPPNLGSRVEGGRPMDRTRSSNADRTSVDLEPNPPTLLRVVEGCPTQRRNMTGDQMQETEVSILQTEQ